MSLPPRLRHRMAFLCLALLSGCLPENDPPAPTRPSPAPTIPSRPSPTTATAHPPAAPPTLALRITRVSPRWDEKQQRFTLVVANTGSQKAKAQAVVYARNESTNPPRRALSPPTASPLWFQLAGSRDGRITAFDIEHGWQSDKFFTARMGKLARTWEVSLAPGEKVEIEAAHDLEEASPHPLFRDRRFPSGVGYTDYQVWMFTPEGFCFAQQGFKVDNSTAVAVAELSPGTNPDPMPEPKPEPKPDPKPSPPSDTRPQASTDLLANTALKVAQQYVRKQQNDLARQQLQSILERYPRTEAAGTARQLLKSLGKP